MSQARKGWYTALLLATIVLMAAAGTLIASALTSLGEDYGLTEFQKGLPATLCSLGSIGALLLAFLLMRWMKKPWILFLSIGMVVGLTALCFFKPTFGLFLTLYALFGLGIGLMDNLCSSSMADVQTGPRAPVMMNLLHACYGIGSMVFPLIFSALMGQGMHWNGLYLVIAGAGALVLIFALVLTPGQASLPMYESMRDKGRIDWGDLKSFFRNSTLRTCVLVIFAVGFFFSGISRMVVDVVDTGYGSGTGSWALSLFFLGVTGGRLLTPLLKIQPLNNLKCSGFAAFLLLMISLFIPNKILLWVVFTLCGFLSGPVIPFSISLACGEMQENTLLASTILFLSLYIGQAIATLLMSAVNGAFGYQSALGVCYLAAMLYSLFALLGFRKKQ